MAMTIMHNSSSMMALGQARKNDTDLGKQLKKVSSGMRINSAGDDSSGYAISERMRTMIRALGQDIQNTKNGGDLVAIAEGGIQEIINNLRSMKAMAINSANDHNTDADRQTIEKEFDSRKQTILDIAATTNYNGKLLLTGIYAEKQIDYSKASPKTLISGFQPAFSSSKSNYTPKTPTTNQTKSGGSVPVDASFIGATTGWNYWTATGQTAPTGTKQSNQMAVALDFSGLSTSYPSGLDGMGFSILCGGCRQYIDIIFDASTTTSSYTNHVTPPPGEAYNSQARAFTIGIQNVTNAADLAKAIFDGVSSVQSQVTQASAADLTATNVQLDTAHNLRLAEINGSYYFLKDTQPAIQFLNGLYGGPKNEFDGTPYIPGTPLIVHTGTKSNQHVEIFINGMYPKDMDLEDVHVVPREAAVAAMARLDHAVDYALNEITRMGAYRMRLEQTEGNLTISEENTQSAESTLRDANMAKEMTGYTKANILTQSAQSMLAQANQSSSNVLSLLQ